MGTSFLDGVDLPLLACLVALSESARWSSIALRRLSVFFKLWVSFISRSALTETESFCPLIGSISDDSELVLGAERCCSEDLIGSVSADSELADRCCPEDLQEPFSSLG